MPGVLGKDFKSKSFIDCGERGRYDRRNKLNSLTGKEWLTLSTTTWFSKSNRYGVLSEDDVVNLIKLFSKEGSKVLFITDSHPKSFGNCTQSIQTIKGTHMNNVFDYVLFEFPLETKSYPNISLLSQIDALSKLVNSFAKLGKYVTIILKESFYTNDARIEFDLAREMERNGFVFKGKVSLIFNSGSYIQYSDNLRILNRHIFLLHFKKIRNIKSHSSEKVKILDFLQSDAYCSSKHNVEYIEPDEVRTSVWASLTKLDEIGKIHPAPFSYFDIERLLKTFTKPGEHVLDPFVGVSSTLIACGRSLRKGTGIDLNEQYIRLSRKRLSQFLFNSDDFTLVHGDSMVEVQKLPHTFDYCVTSPPYHNILRNLGGGVRSDGSQFRQGVVYYSEAESDLGNQKTFDEYLSKFSSIMNLVRGKLKNQSFCSVIISDFTVQKREKNVTAHMINSLVSVGFKYVGTIILVQPQKSIYPFGYPYDFVINHTNQYILNFQR